MNIEPDTISRLAEIETVKAVKQANADLDQARHIVETGLDLYAGDDNLIQPFLELGGVGGVCVHTHVVGPQVAEQVRAGAGRRLRPRTRDRRVAGPGVRVPRRRLEPDRDQGGSPAARASGRRAQAAARGRQRRRAGPRSGLPRAPRSARQRLNQRHSSCVAGASAARWVSVSPVPDRTRPGLDRTRIAPGRRPSGERLHCGARWQMCSA